MAITTTLSDTFQITIPKAVREQQQWQAGQKLALIAKSAWLMEP